MPKIFQCRILLAGFVAALLHAGFVRAATSTPAGATAEETRRAFLAVVDRPRVELAPEVQLQTTEAGLNTFHFTYASEAGQRVPGLLVMKEEFAKDGKRHPVVIALHGTGGKKEGLLGLLKKLAGRGFIAVSIDGRYHGERGNNADYNNAIARAFEEEKNRPHPLYYDTVWDVMRLIDYLQSRPDVDGARIGLTGFSKGGIETWLASAVDTRIAVAIPCIGVQSFGWALDNDAWHPRVATFGKAFAAAAKSAGVDHPDAAFARKFYDRVLPGIYDKFDGPAMLPLIAPRPLMTINGDRDDKNPQPALALCASAATRAYASAGVPEKFKEIIEPNTGHNVTADAQAAAIEWFVKWLGEGTN
jgi:dienelactone hydrolase